MRPTPRHLLVAALLLAAAVRTQGQQGRVTATQAPMPLFDHSDRCQSCHNGLKTSKGENVSIGESWRTTMMANAARDPYWHAGVRRESTDFPAAQAAIEAECSKCHMPAERLEAHAVGREGSVFAHLPVGAALTRSARLAADGVSCTVCHQIAPGKLGQRESMGGNLIVDATTPWGRRVEYGPYDVDAGRSTIMHSAIGFLPTKGTHLRESEFCATCHTLYTHALAPGGEKATELPEQVPYQEWLHSEYKTTKSCQACHMPVIDEPVAVSSVLGTPRTGVGRHTFTGANFLMMRVFGKYGTQLGADPSVAPQEFVQSAERTVAFLKAASATIGIDAPRLDGGRLAFDVIVENRAGHKLPTAYPSRRTWLHVSVRDAAGRTVFESGAVRPDGSIAGNDHDEGEGRYEPHHVEIDRPEQVQVYEAVMVDPAGVPTTGLLTGVRFAKDNRLLPRGFDRATAAPDVAVRGDATRDDDFVGGGDRVRYRVATGGAPGPFTVHAELRYQSIGFRWAENLKRYEAAEPQRFVKYYSEFAAESSVSLAEASATAR